MDYRIAEKPALKVVGKSIRVSTTGAEHLRTIPEFWDKVMQDDAVDQLMTLSSQGIVLPGVILGICTDFSSDHQEFTYMIAAENADGTTWDGLVGMTVPANTYAIFESRGALPEAIQAVWQRIFSEFFPTAQFKHALGPDLEVYPGGDHEQSDYRCEVWIPVLGEANNE
jgi:AraC family transcriptional regulator